MKDITDLILDASRKDLSTSKPFLHNASFTLYDSMSALELTDRKMDSCEIPLSYYQRFQFQFQQRSGQSGQSEQQQQNEGATVPPRPLPKTLHPSNCNNSNTNESHKHVSNVSNDATNVDHNLPWSTLTISETKEITVELLSKFYSFLNGSSLAESVYTCYYVHESILAQMTLDVFSGASIENGKGSSESESESESGSAAINTVGANADLSVDPNGSNENQASTKMSMVARQLKHNHQQTFSSLILGLSDFDANSNHLKSNNSDNNNSHSNIQQAEYEYQLAQTLLCIFCHLLVFNSKLTRKIMLHADIYEEEDFTPSAYKFFNINATHAATVTSFTNINGATGAADLFDKIDVHVEDVITCFQQLQIQFDKARATASQSNFNNNNDALQIIFHSIQFLIHYHTINHTLSTQLNKDNVVEYTTNIKSLIDTIALPNLESLIALISNSNNDDKQQDQDRQKKLLLFKTFDPYLNRHLMGNSPVRNVTSYYATSYHEAIQSIYTIVQELSDATCTLLLHGNDLDSIYSILNQITTTSSPTSSSTDSNTTTTYPKSNIATHASNLNILPRSLIIINLYFNDLLFGQLNLPSIISQSMIQNYNVPQTLIQQTEYGLRFLSRLGKPIYDTIKFKLLNKNRQQTFIRDVMLKEWKVLLQEAAIMDHCFHRDFGNGNNNMNGSDANTSTAMTSSTTNSTATTTTTNTSNNDGSNKLIPFISNYSLYITASLMEHYICVGIEVGLFNGGWHLLTAYWYLDFIASTELNLLVVMRDAMKDRFLDTLGGSTTTTTANAAAMTSSSSSDGNGNKGSKKKGKKGKKNQSSLSSSPSSANTNSSRGNTIDRKWKESAIVEHGMDVLLLKMKRSMYRGIVRSIALLLQNNAISKPNYEFTTTKKIFHKRFECFHQFNQPPPLSYDDFQKGTDFSSVSSNDLIASATDCFKTCRSALDEMTKKLDNDDNRFAANYGMNREEIKKVTKVCIANSLALLKLSQSITRGDIGSCKIEFDFTTHKQYCSINVI